MRHHNLMGILMTGGILAMLVSFFSPYKYLYLLYFSLCGAFVYARNIHYQSREDREAVRISSGLQTIELLKQADEDRFVLFLRPFSIDGEMRRPSLSISSLLFGGFGFLAADRYSGRALTAEGKFAEEIKSSLGLSTITVAEPRKENVKSQGAGQFHLSEDWKGTIKLLIEKAELVLKVPGDTAGSVFEFDYIFSSPENLSKTIFLIPPISATGKLNDARIIALRIIRKVWTSRQLPNYQSLVAGGRAIRFVRGTAICNEKPQNDIRGLSWEMVAVAQDALCEMRMALLNTPLVAAEFLNGPERVFGANAQKNLTVATSVPEKYRQQWKLSDHYSDGDLGLDGLVDYLERLFPSHLHLIATIYLSTLISEGEKTLKINKTIPIENILFLGYLGYCLPERKYSLQAEYEEKGTLVLTFFAEVALRWLKTRLSIQDLYHRTAN